MFERDFYCRKRQPWLACCLTLRTVTAGAIQAPIPASRTLIRTKWTRLPYRWLSSRRLSTAATESAVAAAAAAAATAPATTILHLQHQWAERRLQRATLRFLIYRCLHTCWAKTFSSPTRGRTVTDLKEKKTHEILTHSKIPAVLSPPSPSLLKRRILCPPLERCPRRSSQMIPAILSQLSHRQRRCQILTLVFLPHPLSTRLPPPHFLYLHISLDSFPHLSLVWFVWDTVNFL